MKTTLLSLLTLTLLFIATPTFIHAADEQEKKSDLKVITICPITGDDSEIKEKRAETVDHYKVYFCCGKCQAKFKNLSDTEKLEKIKEAEKKQDSK